VSTSPSTAAKADKFDATYSAVQQKKIEMQHIIEQSRCANAIALQSRDQVFQARLISAQQECKDQDAQEERRLRQRISYETNLTQLLIKDDSGALANDFDRRIQSQLDLEEQRRMQSQASRGRDMLAMLLQGAPQ
jgi:ABC-type anion transport system duplicated permease subunit